MKRFGTFGEYMFDLLFGPLKKGKRAVNQFFIFFKVIGRQFDEVKRAFFRAREEANVVSCSEIMLPIHGQDRDMPRLAGESVEAYRTRLAMKGIISKWSGTKQGILYVLTALGYKQGRIEPAYKKHQEHWAEFTIDLGIGTEKAVRDFDKIVAEVNKVKEASSRLVCIAVPQTPSSTVLRFGGMLSPTFSMPVPELEDHFELRCALHANGIFAIENIIHIPEVRNEGGK